jgi:hypothetical protein
MRALKVLVIVLGVLLVAGVVALIVGIVTRGPRRAEPAKRGFGERIVELPRGAVLADRQVVGDRLVLTISLPDGGHRLLVVEPGSGTVLGTIELRPQGRE